MSERALTVVQALPALEVGGVERGTLEVARELVRHGHRAVVISAGGALVPELEAAGAEHLGLAIGRKRPGTLWLVRRLARELRRLRPDIVHVRSRLPAWVTRLALARLPAAARPALVSTVHGPYTVNRYSAVMTRADRIIAISEFIRDYILASYPAVDPGRVVVVPRGIDPAEFPHGFAPAPAWEQAFRERWRLPAGLPLITQAARITRWKGQAEFLRVLAALRGRGVEVIGLVAGDAEPRRRRFAAELRADAERLGVADAVRFIGARDDLRNVLALSTASVSLTLAPEAFGRTTLESLSLGTPVVGYAHGATAELLAALYPEGACRAGDREAVAGRLAALAAAPRRVPPHTRYRRSDMLAATLAIYAELAGQRVRS